MGTGDCTAVGVTRREAFAAGAGFALAAAGIGTVAGQTAGAPVRVGGTLALTGPLAQTGAIHKVVGEIFIEQTNQAGGMLGRPIEWVLLDDQSKPDLARTFYERLITVDKVDLLMGPYATANILSAMAVAQRFNKILVHHTFGIPKLANYDKHFPAWPLGPEPEKTMPAAVFDALASVGKTPKTVAIVTSKFPSVQFIAAGAREIAKQRGVAEALYLEFEFGNRDFGPIAARVREADADLLFVGAIGLVGSQLLEALDQLNHAPKNHYYVYPTPGPLASSPLGANALAATAYEDLAPLNASPVAMEFSKLFHAAAAKANLPYVAPDTQAGTSYAAWQMLTEAVNATKSLDDQALADYLKKNGADTIVGKYRFDGPNNYGPDLMKVKQVQDAAWDIVWPKELATPGKTILGK
jgi:branched-chain amino acid transport system substrate-binding protein